MRPFGWLPNWPKWEFRPNSEFPELENHHCCAQVGNSVVQRVDDLWTAKLNTEVSKDQLNELQEFFALNNGGKGSSNLEGAVDINALWPRSVPAINIDVDPSLPPGFLASKYKEALLGNSPLAFFPKHIFPKMRMGLTSEAYFFALCGVFLSPNEIDAKYSLDGTDNVSFIEEVRALVDDMRPLSLVLQQLRVRDTQLQVILGLEMVGLLQDQMTSSNANDNANANTTVNTTATEDTNSSRSSLASSTAFTEADLDTHFDRICIWQAVAGTDMLGEFCSSVLIPYFKSRAPRKTKQLVRISRGTLKSRSRALKQKRSSSSPGQDSVQKKKPLPKPALKPAAKPGLLRALSLVHAPVESSSVANSSHSGDNSDTLHLRNSSSRAAARSISHPVYRQQSRHGHGQVEVRFKSSRPKSSIRNSSTPPPPPPFKVSVAAPIPSAPPPPLPKKSPVKPASSAFIEATPAKVRTTYLESLPPPTVLFDDAISSTDSDD